jgi:hypothetical protein
MKTMSVDEIYDYYPLKRYHNSMVHHINKEIDKIKTFGNVLDFKEDQRVVLLLVNLYANVKLWEITSEIPHTDTQKIIKNII